MKIEFRDFTRFEIINSSSSNFLIIKINKMNGSLEEFSSLLKEQLNQDYLSQSGVYFLRWTDGYYIGETGDLFKRLKEHISNKEIDSITFATYKASIDQLDKEQVRDLESLLMDFAKDSGLTLGTSLTNKKNENRKTKNVLNSRENEMNAKYIWNKFTYLNLDEILDQAKSNTILSGVDTNQNSKKNNENYISQESNVSNLNQDEILEIKKMIVKVDVKSKRWDSNNKFYEFVDFRSTPSIGYFRKSIEAFNKETSKKVLFEYLYNGLGNDRVDEMITSGFRRKGYLTAVTLAYLGIETKGTARKSLNNFDVSHVKSMIDKFINDTY